MSSLPACACLRVSSLLPLCPRASPRCEISLLPGPPAGCSSMNNHAPRVPGAAPAGPALSHGITEEERGATRKRARMCHTRAQSLPSRLHRLWSVSRVAGTSFGPPVSLFLSSFLPLCLFSIFHGSVSLGRTSNKRVTFSLQPVKPPTIRSRALPAASVSITPLYVNSRSGRFSFTFQCICVHNVSLGSPRLKSTFDGATKPLAHTPSEPSSSPLLLPSR